jgi:type I restriction enzyme S subunit
MATPNRSAGTGEETALRGLFDVRRATGGTVYELLSLSTEHGVRRAAERRGRAASEDLTNYLRVNVGDLVVNRLVAGQGALAVSVLPGIVSPAYWVLRPKPDVLDTRFCHYLMRSKPVVDAIARVSKFQPPAQFDVLWSDFRTLVVHIPPLDVQRLIGRFLDHADRRIRDAIRAKQKLIALLNEQKQAVIHSAVTRGLDPNVRLKESGLDWLGDVPDHWEVSPLRRRWSVTDCKHLTVPFVDNGIPLASVREVQSFELSLVSSKRTTEEWYEMLIGGGRRPRRGDIIYCRNVSVGAAALVETNEPFAMGQDVCLIRSREQNQRYLNYYMRSGAMQHQLASLLIGSTFKRINIADIKGLTVVVPPRSEQDAIAEFLDTELAGADAAIDSGRRQIELLREYRTRLVADAVTGDLDVREAAARLADEVDEPEPLDELDVEDLEVPFHEELETAEA